MTNLKTAYYTILFSLALCSCANGGPHFLIQQDTLNPDFKILTDSLSSLEFGENCGFDGSYQPLGRKAISNLISGKHYSLIKSILDCNNHEGRIYAIEALLKLNLKGDLELTEMEKQKIKSIIEEDKEINRCMGCESETTYTLWLFAEEKFKTLLDLNEIKIDYR